MSQGLERMGEEKRSSSRPSRGERGFSACMSPTYDEDVEPAGKIHGEGLGTIAERAGILRESDARADRFHVEPSPNEAMFHVEPSLADAEPRKDLPKQFVCAYFAGDMTQRPLTQAKIFRNQIKGLR